MGAARVQLLGEREDVPVPEPRGGAVGDAVGFQPGGDLQRVHGALAQLPVPVQQHLDGVPAGPPPSRPRRRPAARRFSPALGPFGLALGNSSLAGGDSGLAGV